VGECLAGDAKAVAAVRGRGSGEPANEDDAGGAEYLQSTPDLHCDPNVCRTALGYFHIDP
jgi:hypothetical protein